jgi:hypothetical protein
LRYSAAAGRLREAKVSSLNADGIRCGIEKE